jgi:hypothetical protein
MSRKGDVGPAENISTFIGGMILLGMFVILVVFVFNYFTDFGVMMQVSSNQLSTIDFAYMAEDCLTEEGEYYIRSERLDAFSGEIRNECGIRIEDGGIMVTNLETGKKWVFGYSGGDKYRYGIFVNIKEGDEIYVGQLNASIDA